MQKELNRQIGARIRRDREAMGLSREVFAEQAGMSPSFLAAIELGGSGFTTDILVKLCRTLGVSADYLLFEPLEEHDLADLTVMLSGLDKRYLPPLRTLLCAYLQAVSLADTDGGTAR